MNELIENKDISVLELNENHKQIPIYDGIYAYINKNYGKIYIGKANNLRQRFLQHKNNKKAKNFDKELQSHPENFDYRILIFNVDPSILDSLESSFIHRYSANQLYNLRPDKVHGITPDDENIYQMYSNLRQKYVKLYNEYTDILKENAFLKQEFNDNEKQ